MIQIDYTSPGGWNETMDAELDRDLVTGRAVPWRGFEQSAKERAGYGKLPFSGRASASSAAGRRR